LKEARVDGASVEMHVSNALAQFMTLTLPPLIAALVVGLVVGIVQAATQIQDQTMPQTVKLLVVVAVLALLGPILSAPLIEGAKRVFTEFPALTARG
jgi:type III secretion protein S